MSYVKKYEVGNVQLNAPRTHFVHELPLLAFGDAQHSIGLSLVFNSGAMENSFNISQGYKFNLQKRLILSEDGVPTKLEDGNGVTVDLINFREHFMFDDDSQRIIRVQGNTFKLENPDYSKEMYDSFGRITAVYDKYGEVVLAYHYSSSGKMDKITYRDNKVIQFNYFATLGMVESVQYICNGVIICTTTFSYPGAANVTVCHYSGVDYTITYSQGEFVVYSADHGAQYSNDHSQKITCNLTATSLVITKEFGDKVVDTTTYAFVNRPEEGKFDLLDVTDQHGIKTRMQFQNGKLAYSYEMRDDMFRENSTTESCTYFGTVTHHSNGQTAGAQTYGDGIQLINCDSNKWYYPMSLLMDESECKNAKSVVVSGWVKKKPNTFVTGDRRLSLTFSDYNVLSNKELLFGELPLNQWVYFSGVIDLSERIEEEEGEERIIKSIDLDAPTVTLSENPTYFEGADIRIVPQYLEARTGSTGTHITSFENALIILGTTLEQKFDSETSFYNGNVKLDKVFTEKDIIKYLLNQARGEYKNEIYFNNCRGIQTNVTDFKVIYTDSMGKPAKASVEDVAFEKRYVMNGRKFAVRTEVYSTDSECLFATKTYLNDSLYKEERYNNNFELVYANNDGAITTYERNNKGLVVSQTVTDENESILGTTTATYNDDITKLVSETDAFGTVTTYTTDDVWGVVTQVKVNNEVVVTSTFDDDYSAQMSKTFGQAPNTKLHEFGYSNGAINMMKNDTLTYSFGYNKDVLSSVSKNNQPIEQFEVLENGKKVKAHYPNSTNPQYTITQNYDNYGRLTQVEGLITNTYDLNPTFSGDVHNVIGINNGSSKLATSTDHVTGKVEKYGYTKDKLSHIIKVDSYGNKVNMESFTYDEIGRLRSDTHVYDVEDNKSVRSEVAYHNNASHPSANDLVYTYAYNVNGVRRAYCYNERDVFNRLKKKNITITPENHYITKTFTYDKNQVSTVREMFSETNLGTNSYTYDDQGRIQANTFSSATSGYQKSYKYDNFGQIIRENNEALDKTCIYEYNSIGNIKLVKTYDYSTSSVPEGDCTPTTYEYDTTYPDRLISFNGNAITYDAQGYPTFYKGKNYNWSRGRLTKINIGSSMQPGSLCDECIFTYDAYGRRIEKNYVFDVNPGVSGDYSYRYNTKYQYDHSGRLVRELLTERNSAGDETTKEFIYLYDETGMIGVMYNSIVYYYLRNLQGDVIAIYNASGEKKVEYAYDAWGNCTIVYAEDLAFAKANPIRYRGYYFDRETGLYHLNARYYSPEWRRFISPDSSEYIDPETPNGLNLYAYCNNDPVNYADPSGTFAFTTTMLIAMAIGAVSLGTLGGITAYQNAVESGQTGWDLVNATLSGVSTGIILGAAVGFVASAGISYFVGGIASVAGKLIGDTTTSFLMGTNSFGSWESYAVAFVFGGLLKGSAPDKATRMFIDVFARPAFDQVVKMGTQGKNFDGRNYLYSVLVRGSTHGLYGYNPPTFLLGREISLSFEKIITRSFYTTMGKKFILN